jgi:Coiled stalk of trimeric autotransporter adhesin/YadA-like membrane anchor domain
MMRSKFRRTTVGHMLKTSAVATCLIAHGANAQVVAPPQVPLSDMQCNYPVGAPPSSQFGLPAASTCTTAGTRNIAAPTVTQTPSGATATRVTGEWVVNYAGALAIDGVPVSLVNGQQFSFDATNFYDSGSVSANVTTAYTGRISFAVPNAQAAGVASTMQSFTPGEFYEYSVASTTLNSLAVNIANATASSGGRDYDYSLASSPTIINGNSVAVAGQYQNQNNDGAIVFGTLSGTAVLTNSAVSNAPILDINGNPTGAWRSLHGLQFNITATEVTKLDQTGLITPTVSVTNGIQMNGSRITGLAAGTATTDAVNKSQLDAATAYVKVNGTGALATAAGANAIAIGADSNASQANTIALGQGANAQSAGALAIGTNAKAVGGNSFSVGASSETNGLGTVAFGNASYAGGENALAFGYGSQGTSANATSLGTFSRAQAVGATAVGFQAAAVHSGSTAIGTNSATTAANQIRLGTTGTSVSIADIGASDAAQAGQEFFLTIDNSGTVGKGAQSSAVLAAQSSMISELQVSQALIDDTVATHTSQIAGLNRGLDGANAGIAASMALGGMMVVPDSALSVNFNLATYRGEQGFAGGLIGRVSPKVYINAGVAGSSRKGSTGGRVGIAFGL